MLTIERSGARLLSEPTASQDDQAAACRRETSTRCPWNPRYALLGRVSIKHAANAFDEEGHLVTRVWVIFSTARVVPELEPR